MQPYEKYLKENSQKLRVDQTDAERKLWQRINRDQLLGFRFNRQKPLLSYIVDFYCAKANLVVELDGSPHYEDEGIDYDAARTKYLEQYGLTVIRIPNNEINHNFDGVCEYLDNLITKSLSQLR